VCGRLAFFWGTGESRRAAFRLRLAALRLTPVVLVGALCWLSGRRDHLLVRTPTAWLAGAAGIWLFHVQHQFEEAYWQSAELDRASQRHDPQAHRAVSFRKGVTRLLPRNSELRVRAVVFAVHEEESAVRCSTQGTDGQPPAYADEYAVRVNRSVELLVDLAPADVVRALQVEHALSERQARRYVNAALERPGR
jgi:hypothetical protein